jgi:hypothetical protein
MRCTTITTIWLSSVAVLVWSTDGVTATQPRVVVSSVSSFLDFEDDLGGVADDDSAVTCAANSQLLSTVLNRYNNTSRYPLPIRLAAPNRTIYFHPGIVAQQVHHVQLIVDGTVRFERPPDYDGHDAPLPCLMFLDSHNVTLTSTARNRDQRGVMDGQGSQYWGVSIRALVVLYYTNQCFITLTSRTTPLLSLFSTLYTGAGHWLLGIGGAPTPPIQGQSNIRHSN